LLDRCAIPDSFRRGPEATLSSHVIVFGVAFNRDRHSKENQNEEIANH
jgi:hypothetical protein